MSQQRKPLDLTQGSVTRNLLLFSLPFLASSILQTLYSTVDTIIVGQFVGSAGLTAVNNTSYITNAMSNIGLGASAGAAVLVSQYAGAKQYDGIRRTLGTALTISLSFAVVLSLLVCTLMDPLLGWINIPEQALTEAHNYLMIRAVCLVFSFTYNTLTSVLRGTGDSKRPMYFVAVASVMNVFLDLLFVGAFQWGAGGAAVATELSQLFALVWAILYIRKKQDQALMLRRQDFRIHWPTAKVVLKVGIPSSFQYLFIDLSFVFVNSMINAYGIIASSAVAVGSKVVNLGQVGLSALSTGAATMAGQNIGAGKPDRAGQTIRVGVRVALSTSLVVLALIQLFPEQLVRLFNSEPDVITEGVRCLRILSLMYIPASFLFIYTCIANAVGFTTFALLCYILDGVVVRIAASVLLSKVLGMGLVGIYWGMGLAPSLSAILAGAYFYSGKWRNRKLLENKALQVED
jgi:putative MATE family efflux protein